MMGEQGMDISVTGPAANLGTSSENDRQAQGPVTQEVAWERLASGRRPRAQ